MKKLMMAVAIVCAAAFAHAATIVWGSTGVQTTGDFDSGDGDFANGYLVYLFDAGAYNASEIVNGFVSADASTRATYLSEKALATATTSASGTFTGSFTGADADQTAFLVILDASSVADANYIFASDNYNVTYSKASNYMDYDGDKYVNALDYSTAGTAGSNWTALSGGGSVPEPTSGLLLVLGLAGLALRRKQA